MVMNHVGFSFDNLFKQAVAVHSKHEAILAPGKLVNNPIEAVSLGIGLLFGTAGLPHVLMRFFTVPDIKQRVNLYWWQPAVFLMCFS